MGLSFFRWVLSPYFIIFFLIIARRQVKRHVHQKTCTRMHNSSTICNSSKLGMAQVPINSKRVTISLHIHTMKHYRAVRMDKTGTLSNIIHKNKLKMDWRSKCKTRNYKTPRGKHRQYTLQHSVASQQDPLWPTSQSKGNKSKNKQIGPN